MNQEDKPIETMPDIEKFESRSPEVPAVVQQDGFLAVIERLSAMPDIPVDKIKQLFEMQEAALDRAAKQEFNAAMTRAQGNMPIVPKDKKNNQTNSRYSSYEMILKHTQPVYTAEGFSLTMYEGMNTQKSEQFPSVPEGNARTYADVMHSAGWSKTFYIDMPIDDKGIKGTVNKTGPHAKKSSLSYGRSSLACLIFNIPTGDGDDGNAAGAGSQKFITLEQVEELTKELAKFPDKGVEFLKWIGAETVDTIYAGVQHKKAVEGLKAIKKGKK